MPSKNVAFIEGEAEAQDIIFALADEIAGATWNEADGTPVSNRWEEVYRQEHVVWVEYEQKYQSTVGSYVHTNGASYPVYVAQSTGYTQSPDTEGFIYEKDSSGQTNTGRKMKVVGDVTYTDMVTGEVVTKPIDGLYLASTPDGVAILEQERRNLDGSYSVDVEWNEFRLHGYLPAEFGDWGHFLSSGGWNTGRVYSLGDWRAVFTQAVRKTFQERYYQPTLKFNENTVVFKCTPDVPQTEPSYDFYVMFKQPHSQYNYFDVYYGLGFAGVESEGRAEETYIRACNLSTVKIGTTPVVINQLEAEAAYQRQLDVEHEDHFTPPTETWAVDIDGTTLLKSPPAHYHFGCNSVVPWLVNKKRRPDYMVSYWISINNDRLCIILEGDPAPDLDAYYRSFAYIGKITPFNDFDHAGNFFMTVGMGDLTAEKTGFLPDDIKQDTNPTYSGFGRYTSNGMYSVSALRTRSNVLFQAYYPAFITQLPDYGSVGTIPTGLSKLILENNGFQASQWTSKYHASPIYLVHQYEGYRGYMIGVVAVDDHNILSEDELVVDTQEAKPGGGTYEEVYKFFSIKTPVNFFKSSANPTEMSIAVLKEVR